MTRTLKIAAAVLTVLCLPLTDLALGWLLLMERLYDYAFDEGWLTSFWEYD